MMNHDSELLLSDSAEQILSRDVKVLPEDLRRMLHLYRYEHGYTFRETAVQIGGISWESVRRAEKGVGLSTETIYKILTFLRGIWLAESKKKAKRGNHAG